MILKERSAAIKTEFILWGVLAFLMPLWQSALPLVLAGLLVLRFLFRSARPNPVKRVDKLYLVLFISFYALHALGMLWTINSAHGLFDLQVKLSLVLLPLLLFTTPLDREDIVNAGLGGLVAGSLLAAVLSFVYAIVNYLSGANEFITGKHFAFYMHTGYYASFFCLSFIILTELLIRRNKLFSAWSLRSVRLGIVLLASAILFTLSRTGTLVLVASIVALAIYAIIRFRSKKLLLLFIVGGLGASLAVGLKAERLVGRFTGMFEKMDPQHELDLSATDANTVRILLWDVSKDLICDNIWIGVGTGDIKDELRTRSLEKGYTGTASMDLNAHNQFTQSFITLGIGGFVLILLLFLVPFIEGLRRRSMLILLCTLLFGLFCTTESYLERQAGIMAFALVLPLLVFHFRNFRKDPTDQLSR